MDELVENDGASADSRHTSSDLNTQAPLLTRNEVESGLKALQSGAHLPGNVTPECLLHEAKGYPDIAQIQSQDLSSVPDFVITALRLESGASRYVYVHAKRETPCQGLYHVHPIQNGTRLIVARAESYRGRMLHDPFSIEPEEASLATAVYLHTKKYTADPLSVFGQPIPDNVPPQASSKVSVTVLRKHRIA